MSQYPRVALIFKTRLEENIRILNSIAKYNRFHEQWTTFLDDQAVAQHSPEWLLRKGWDGVICKHSAPKLFQACSQRNIPCVDLSDDQTHFSKIPKIKPDNQAIGQVGAEYFIEKGYRHHVFCGFSSETWSCERRDGYLEALNFVSLKCDVFESEYPKVSDPDWEEAEQSKICDWLTRLPKPLCIMACNDLRALQVIHACRSLNLQIPEEVAVLGANNESIRCELSNPQLSSIPINTDFYGQTAAETLSRLMQGSEAPSSPVLIDPQNVVTRRSTDVLAIEDKHVAAALNLIRNFACDGITVDEIVRKIKVSRSILERRFRKYLGKSPQVEIRNFQVRRIKQFLQETDYTLAHIAELTGFEHPEYMCVVFKRLTGETPKQHRQKYR